jgi:hypothetical protein
LIYLFASLIRRLVPKGIGGPAGTGLLCPSYHGKRASSANGFCLPELPADGLESSIMFLRSHSLFLGDPSFSTLVLVVGLSLAIRIGFEIE